uniref:Uncharacterized protein n=1 Tax=Timema bartmani TaxID=61472 RepID=A0A7R9ERG8_9NEOP|nr:unnamed protein product [Timema bartmani]
MVTPRHQRRRAVALRVRSRPRYPAREIGTKVFEKRLNLNNKYNICNGEEERESREPMGVIRCIINQSARTLAAKSRPEKYVTNQA